MALLLTVLTRSITNVKSLATVSFAAILVTAGLADALRDSRCWRDVRAAGADSRLRREREMEMERGGRDGLEVRGPFCYF